MLENTAKPSGGHPPPVVGSHSGDEYLRRPTSVIPSGPMVVPLGMIDVGPYGKCKSTGRVVPPGIKKELSAKNGPQDRSLDSAGIASAMPCKSRHVCGLPGFKSCVASKRWPCRPTYAICNDKSFASSRWIVRLYCSAYCVRGFLAACPNKRIGRNNDQSTGCPRGGFKIPLNGFGNTVPSWPANGVLNCVLNRNVLPPNGGSALNCSSTNCSTGL